MKQQTALRRALSWLTAAAMSMTMLAGVPLTSPSAVQAAETGSRIRVDINKNDGRKASYTRTANNWIVDGTYTYTVGGVTCKLSSGGSGSVDVVNNKVLQLQDVEKTPTLTMDGAKIKDASGNPTLKLEISGLSNGTHSIQTWHACADRNVTNSSLTVKVGGKTVASGLKCPVNPTNSNDAAMAYGTFTGSSVTVEITAEGNGTLNTPWLSAFEIDGSDPFHSISRITPADQELHHQASAGLSWTAGAGAASHNVYIGTDFSAVSAATTSSPEFKGNVTKPSFALDDTYSSIPTYYWRVDEVQSDGSVVPGAVYSFHLARLAFPTAEGYGRFARGGRGGYVYHVTNLNDSGEGSLRYGLETLTGARTIVFDVGGVIALSDTLWIPENGGDVYVAGQTAPGDGITLINYDFGGLGAWDAVIRDVRVRVGDMDGKSTGGMGLGSCNHCIVDHCSISWATDEGFSSRSASNITFQWNIIGESLNNSVHYDANDRSNVERHAFAASIGGFTGSFHHNLLINNTGRNWSLAGAMEQDGVTYGGQLDISNNVVYNWRDRTTDGGARRVQFVNNYYKAGPVSNTSLHLVSVDGNELNTSDMQMLYASGNMKVAQNGSTLIAASADEWSSGKAKCGGSAYHSSESTVRSNSPWFENYITLQSAEDAYKSVINNTTGAGANIPALDYIDSRYHKEVTNGTYTYTGSKDGLKGIIDSQTDVGGYPNSSNFKSGTAAADTDRDGMPDAWENEHGLNPKDASDGPIVSLSADDYTNLELYLNECAGDPVEFNGNVRTIDAFSRIEAEEFDEQSGIKTQECSDEDGGEQVAYVENGDYILFKNVDFTGGARSFLARLAGNDADIELYLDNMSGDPYATLHYTGAGNWTDWSTVSCNVPTITGRHKVYVKFTGGEGYLVNLNWFTFSHDAQGRLIKDVRFLDTTYGSAYSLSDNAGVGSLVYGDREFTYTALPAALEGAEMIVTACDAKALTSEIVSFTAREDIRVYMVMDNRVSPLPSWMASYTKFDGTAASENDVVYDLYYLDVAAGESVTISGNGQSSGCRNYGVLIAEAAEEPTEPPTQAPTEAPTDAPTDAPAPTEAPTNAPEPTDAPTDASTEAETLPPVTMWGDSEGDGDVDIIDVIAVNKDQLGSLVLTAQGRANADVNQNGTLEFADAVLIMKSLVDLVTIPV
ncbi:MAG: carbohydrate-binding protein [Oscillospiraceae bacterium]|nr:carbohydrate-binding protein [Oscillospiraceae bacterium]